MFAEPTHLVLVKSEGTRRQYPFADRVEVQLHLNLQAPGDGHPNYWFVEADVTVRAQESGEDQYEGGSAYGVTLGDGETPPPPDLFAAVWPHLRADLVAQCARVAGQSLSLPVSLKPEALQVNRPTNE